MLAWFQQNWGTLVVVAVLATILFAIVWCQIRARRAGKGGCGCGCAQCAMQGVCHTRAPEDKK